MREIRSWGENEAKGGGWRSFSAGLQRAGVECVQYWFVMLISGTCGIVYNISSFMVLVQKMNEKKSL